MTARVVVTGAGAVSPFGVGVEAFRDGVFQGRSTAAPIRSFDASGLSPGFACEVPEDFDPLPFLPRAKMVKTMSRATQLGVAAARMAWEAGGPPGLDPFRTGIAAGVGGLDAWDTDTSVEMVLLGQGVSEEVAGDRRSFPRRWVERTIERSNPVKYLCSLPNMAAAHIAIVLGLRGECTTVSTACTSSTQAIGDAFRLVRAGKAIAMLAGGCDAPVNPMLLAGFTALGVLSRRCDAPARASRPFDRDRDGFVLGEGAAFLVLEDREHALRRGAPILAEVAGYASTNDGYRLTDEDPSGAGGRAAMVAALADAATRPEEVDYVNAHGTGTRMNDVTEARVIASVLGAEVPVSSTKSMIGHGLAASGALESLACILAIGAQRVPPTANLENPDPECRVRHVACESAPHRIEVALKNSFGFGGQNACLVFRRCAP